LATGASDLETLFPKTSVAGAAPPIILNGLMKQPLPDLRTVLLALPAMLSAAVAPNPKISLKKPVFASPTSNASALTDGKFGSPWAYSANAWAAIKLEPGPNKILVSWNDPTGNWSDSVPTAGVCQKGTTFPRGYRLSTSANSTNGSDGTWTLQATVSDNVVSARSHQIGFDGASWVKVEVTGGTGGLDEIEVFDVSNGLSDSWFFLGTSISQMTFKSSSVDSSFSDLVHARFPSHTPAMVRGGVPCISSSNVVASLSRYLDLMTGVRFVAIEMGTNDAWNGSTYNLPAFKKNMQTLVDSIRGRGMEPVIARVLATDPSRANWQIDPSFPLAVDTLRIKNNLVVGPDFDAWFRKHPEELNPDGVHPNAVGAQSIQRLWADAVASGLYGTTSGTLRTAPLAKPVPRTFDPLGRQESSNRGSILPRLTRGSNSLEIGATP